MLQESQMEEGGIVHRISIKLIGAPVPPGIGKLDARKEEAIRAFSF